MERIGLAESETVLRQWRAVHLLHGRNARGVNPFDYAGFLVLTSHRLQFWERTPGPPPEVHRVEHLGKSLGQVHRMSAEPQAVLVIEDQRFQLLDIYDSASALSDVQRAMAGTWKDPRSEHPPRTVEEPAAAAKTLPLTPHTRISRPALGPPSPPGPPATSDGRDDHATRVLGELIRAHGAELWQHPRRLKGLLTDLCPGSTRQVTLLLLAVEEGVPTGLVDTIPAEELRERQDSMRRRLAERRGLSPEAAEWAVRAWTSALRSGA